MRQRNRLTRERKRLQGRSESESASASRKRPIYFNEAFKGWTVNFLKENFWRVAPRMDYEDALQQCQFLFYKVRSRYADTIENPRHMMGLYQTSVRRWFDTESVKASKHRETFADSPDWSGPDHRHTVGRLRGGGGGEGSGGIGESDNMYPALSVFDGTEEIGMILRAVSTAPAEVLDIVSTAIRTGTRMRKANAALCRLLGRNPEREDLVKMVRSHFFDV